MKYKLISEDELVHLLANSKKLEAVTDYYGDINEALIFYEYESGKMKIPKDWDEDTLDKTDFYEYEAKKEAEKYLDIKIDIKSLFKDNYNETYSSDLIKELTDKYGLSLEEE